MFVRFLSLLLLLLSNAVILCSQTDTPIISGGVQYLNTTTGGATVFQPVIAPVVAVPIGDRWLIESRATFDEVIFRENGTSGPWHALTFSSVDYLQLDFVANSHLTIVVGEFLTPFNIYNERLSPVWIHNLADAPLIAGIGTRTTGSSDGGMVRGVAASGKDWQLSYTAYFSTLVNASHFGAGRTAGGRLPARRRTGRRRRTTRDLTCLHRQPGHENATVPPPGRRARAGCLAPAGRRSGDGAC